MNPDSEPQEPISIDPPDNTSDGSTIDTDLTAGEDVPQSPAINPPDNT